MDKISERRSNILRSLSLTPITTIAELSERFHVSIETIRKDLNALEDENLVARVHGGVALASTPVRNSPFDQRKNLNSEIKVRVAKAACKLIEPGDVIMLESSTTTTEMVRELLHYPDLLRSVVIITNSFLVTQLLEGGDNCGRMFFMGGWTNFAEHSTQGQYTMQSLKSFHVNKAFISGAAFSDDWTLSGYYEDDVAFQKEIVDTVQSTVLLLDSSKLHKTAVLSVCHVSKVHYLVTDAALPEEGREYLRTVDVTLLQA